MSTTTITTQSTSTNNPLFQVVTNYLNGVKTSKGTKPTDEQKKDFLQTCIAHNLNPIKKQAYLVGYDTRDGANFTTITSIGGYTSIATSTGEYAGLDQPRFSYNGDKIDSCSVTVYRLVRGTRCAFTGNAYFSERNQNNTMWQKNPKTMIEKCARASALRNAFPDEFSNIYTSDEMPEVKESPAVSVKPVPVESKISDTDVKRLHAVINEYLASQAQHVNEKTIQKVKDGIKTRYQVESTKDLTKNQFDQVIVKLNTAISKV